MCSRRWPQWQRPRPMTTSLKHRQHWTPQQARQLVAEVKGASDAQAAERFRRRFVHFDDERCLLWAQLSKDAYALVKTAIVGRARRHDHPSSHDPDFVRFESRCADALLDICIEAGRRSRRTGPRGPMSRVRAGAGAGAGASSGYDPDAEVDAEPDADSTSDEPPGSGHAPGPRSARIAMVVHTDLERLLYGDGYGHASIEGVGPISAEVARRLACTADITVSFDAPDGACLDQKSLVRDPSRSTGDRDPAQGRRVPLPRLRLSHGDRHPPRPVGLEAGSDHHVEPLDTLCRPPQPGARARLDARRRRAGRGEVHQPAGARLRFHAFTRVAASRGNDRRLSSVPPPAPD